MSRRGCGRMVCAFVSLVAMAEGLVVPLRVSSGRVACRREVVDPTVVDAVVSSELLFDVPGTVDMGGATSLLLEPVAEVGFGGRVLESFGAVDLRIAGLQACTSLFGAIFGFGDAVIAIPLLALLFRVDAVRAAMAV